MHSYWFVFASLCIKWHFLLWRERTLMLSLLAVISVVCETEQITRIFFRHIFEISKPKKKLFIVDKSKWEFFSEKVCSSSLGFSLCWKWKNNKSGFLLSVFQQCPSGHYCRLRCNFTDPTHFGFVIQFVIVYIVCVPFFSLKRPEIWQVDR